MLSDLSALTYGYRYKYKELQRQAPLVLAAEAAEVEVLVTFTEKAQPDTTDFCQVQQRLQSTARRH